MEETHRISCHRSTSSSNSDHKSHMSESKPPRSSRTETHSRSSSVSSTKSVGRSRSSKHPSRQSESAKPSKDNRTPRHSSSSHSSSSDESSKGKLELTKNEKVLINNEYRLSSKPRPLDDPLFPFPKDCKITDGPIPTSKEMLSVPKEVFSADIRKWVEKLFHLRNFKAPKVRKELGSTPIRDSALTIIVLVYPDPKKDMRRPKEVFLDRIKTLANMMEQMIIYVCPELKEQVKTIRPNDKRWHVISDYKTIWHIPTNKHPYSYFDERQVELFEELKGEQKDWKLNATYNSPHKMAAYNAKAFVTYDAIIRNPFGSDRSIYMNAGLFIEDGVDQHDIVWGDIMKEKLDSEKFDRSIKISENTGVVMGGYRLLADHGDHGIKSINHKWFSHRERIW
jgi:hypothetical protein